jgi:hypothetical protein
MRIATVLALVAACGDDGVTAPDGGMADSATDVAIDATLDAPGCPAPRTITVATASEVLVINDLGSTLGIFDPSVVYPAGAPGGALAYSSVPAQNAIRTRIAVSPDAGATWTYVGEANTPEAAAIASTDANDCPGGTCTGQLISEVPTLVLDPGEPVAAKRWKLFAHRYLVSGVNTLHYRLGTMTIQTAPDPQGPWTVPEKLFGLSSPSAYTTQGARYNASTFAGMTDCLALTEPSAIVLPGALDLAMGCVYLDGATPRIKVVAARSTDHGQTWASLGRILGPGAGDCLAGTAPGASINAPNLFVGPDGKEYLSITSSDTGYHGCAIYQVDDPGTGHVAALPSALIVPDTGQFSGACTWSAGGGGYQMDIGFLATARPFRIFRAGAF